MHERCICLSRTTGRMKPRACGGSIAAILPLLHSSRRCDIVFVLAAAVALTTVVPFLYLHSRPTLTDTPPLKPRDDSSPQYHVVFSTSCTDQQNWESYVFFYHCMRVRQRGTVTRIVSGCNERESTDLQKFHKTYIATMAIDAIQSFELHLTPDYSRIKLTEGKYPYKYMNKPYGLLHWMEHRLHLRRKDDNSPITSPYYDNGQIQLHEELLDGIVFLLDPDMVLLKPLTHEYLSDDEMWVKKPDIPKVIRGHPISQQDGYLTSDWMKLNMTYITGDSTLKLPQWNEGSVHWNTGPPYLATVFDMYRIVLMWTRLTPRVVDVYPHLFAEMFGFIISTVVLNLPFSMTKSLVVSTTETTNREAWEFIDTLPDKDICRVPVAAMTSSHLHPTPVLPTGLHYCKRYLLGRIMFSKYRLKKNIMNCEKGLLKLPPDDVFPAYNYTIAPPRADGNDMHTYSESRQLISTKRAKREAFMLCGMISAVNEALRHYKRIACGKDNRPPANFNETYTIHDDPSKY